MLGECVNLRAMMEADSPHYFRWINDKELVQFNAPFKPVSEAQHDQWFASVGNDPRIVVFSIVENKSDILIGSCSLRHIDLLHQHAELQIRIGEMEYHNRGYGTEAVNLLVEHGFYDLNLSRIYLHVFADNERAIRSYEKCGFEWEGTLRNAVFIDGEFKNIHLMAILK